MNRINLSGTSAHVLTYLWGFSHAITSSEGFTLLGIRSCGSIIYCICRSDFLLTPEWIISTAVYRYRRKHSSTLTFPSLLSTYIQDKPPQKPKWSAQLQSLSTLSEYMYLQMYLFSPQINIPTGIIHQLRADPVVTERTITRTIIKLSMPDLPKLMVYLV